LPPGIASNNLGLKYEQGRVMGDNRPGGEAANARADLWGLWRGLKGLFPVWSLIPSALYTPGAWGYVGVDFVSGFRRNPSTIRAFALLEGVEDALFDDLSALADLNARRQDQLLRAVVIGYLTVPLSILALLAELAGDSVMTFVRANLQLTIQMAVAASLDRSCS
jgi:hypothetical protein